MAFDLVDDGTLDTVLQCTECGTELRYTFDGEHQDCNPIANGDCDCYGRFIDQSKADTEATHECRVC